MIAKEQIIEVVNSHLSGGEIELVSVKCSMSNEIEVTVDSLKGVVIEDCISITKHIESCFDREQEDYELTVASQSISDPFVTKLQYEKNLGKEVEILFATGLKLTAILVAFDEDSIDVKYQKKMLLEGKKRKQLVDIDEKILLVDIKTIRSIINF